MLESLKSYGLGLRRRTVLVALCCLPALLLAACAAPLPPRPDLDYSSGILWQVQRDDAAPSFVFGTMHVPDPEILSLPPAVESAFAESELAAFELVSEKDSLVRERRRFLAAAMLPDNQSLSELMDEVAYSQLIRIARRQRPSPLMVGRTHISNFKPWFVLLIIGRNDASASHLDPGTPTLDDWLELRAKEAGKDVFALESFEEQLAVFDDMSMDDQIAVLTARLNAYNSWRSYRTSADFYLGGDTAMLYALWEETLEGLEPALADRFTERFLTQRNRNMAERLTPYLAKGSTFVAIGALHLPGEEGILALLEQRGYRVTRLH